MTRFQRLIAYAAMTAALFHAALFVGAQQTGNPFINRITGPGSLDAGGSGNVNTSGMNNTYTVGYIALAVPTGGTDVACLTGSSTKKVSVSKVFVSGTAATQVSFPIKLTKNASLSTQGTGTQATPYAYWSNNTASTAVATGYTVSPTVSDSSAGLLGAIILTLPTTSTNVATGPAVFSFGNQGGVGQPTLLSAAQQLCVNMGGASVTTGLLTIFFEFSEY